MPLAELEACGVRQKSFDAEVKALYFADLAYRAKRKKYRLEEISLFVNCVAMIALAVNLRMVSFGILTASLFIGAYAIASYEDWTVTTLTMLHSRWNSLNWDYEQLSHKWKDDDASRALEALDHRAKLAEQTGSEIRINKRLIEQWYEFVLSRREKNGLTRASGAL